MRAALLHSGVRPDHDRDSLAARVRANVVRHLVEAPPIADAQVEVGDGAPNSGSPAWGALPVLSVIAASGLAIVSYADALARRDAASANAVFWLGLLILYVPIVFRLAMQELARQERVGLVAVLGCSMYVVKLMHSPNAFTFPDEFLHWRTADDILISHRLFSENPVLPVSALYPGLESVSTALASMSGLSVFASGAIVVGAARLVLMLALYLTLETLSGSGRVAGLATAIYATNSNYVFFNGQFKYETLALALAAFTLFLAAQRWHATPDQRRAYTVLTVLSLAGLVMSHHMTSYVLTGLLGLWTVTAWFTTWVGRRWPSREWTEITSECGPSAARAYAASADLRIAALDIPIAHAELSQQRRRILPIWMFLAPIGLVLRIRRPIGPRRHKSPWRVAGTFVQVVVVGIAGQTLMSRGRVKQNDRRVAKGTRTFAAAHPATYDHSQSATPAAALPADTGSLRTWHWPAALLALAVIFNVGWLLAVAPTTVGYLSPVLGGAISSVIQLIIKDSSQEPARELFKSRAGVVATPPWERIATLASVAIVLLALPIGLLQIAKRYRRNAVVVALAIATLVYPAGLVMRLTGRGWESANRSSESTFVALGLVLAIGATGWGLSRYPGLKGALPIALCSGILLIGGIVAGWPYEWRLPRPYIAAQDPRSIETQGIADAKWARQYLGPNNRIGADRTNHQLFGSYGGQHMMTNLSGTIDPNWVLFAPILDRDKLDLLKKGQVEYLVVDYRMINAPWVPQRYFPGVSVEVALRKFDQAPGANRIFDSGAIVIFDVKALSDVP